MQDERSIRLQGDLTEEKLAGLEAGDRVLYTGCVFTARDAAHKRIVESLAEGGALPFDIDGSVIYFAGPAPAKPGAPIGPIGPTSSYRMDPYSPCLLDMGLAAMIGKGRRNAEVKDAIIRNGAVYFAAIGGAAALIAKSVKSATVVAYEDLGTEAIRKLDVVDMPLTVAIDAHGNDIYEIGPADYLAAQARSKNSSLTSRE